MSWQDSIKTSIRTIAGTKDLKNKPDVYYASVDSVDMDTRTCSCTLISGTSDISLTNVNLMAEVNDGILRIPTVGSTVYILSAPNITPFVDIFSQIDNIIYIVGDTEFSMINGTAMLQQGDMTITLSDNKINIQNGDDDTIVLQQGEMTITLSDHKISVQNGSDDTIVVQQDEMAVTLSSGMINIKNGSKNFTTIMQNILNHIQALTVSTGTGPSSVPINVSDFSTDLSDLNEILN